MKGVYVDAFAHYFSTNSHHWIYSSIIGLAALDVLSTYGASIVLGRLFLEVGLVAGFLMKLSPDSWPVFMFISEAIIFSGVGFFLTRGKNVKSSIKVSRWNVPLAYLPALTLLVLVLNNTILIAIFSLFM